MIHPSTNLDGQIVSKLASFAQDSSGDPKITVAAATEDNVEVTGVSLDRMSGTAICDSAVLAVTYGSVLTQDKTLSFGVKYQDSADNSTWNTAVVLQAATVAATGGTGGSTESGVVELGLNMKSLNRYVRFNITADLSHTSTDTALWSANASFGGYDQGPK